MSSNFEGFLEIILFSKISKLQIFCWNLLSKKLLFFISSGKRQANRTMFATPPKRMMTATPRPTPGKKNNCSTPSNLLFKKSRNSPGLKLPVKWVLCGFFSGLIWYSTFRVQTILFDIIISGNFFKLLSLMISLLLLLIHFIFFHPQDPRKGKLIQASLNTRKIHCFWGLWRWSSQGNEKKELQYRFCSDTFCCKQSTGTNSTKCYSLSCALAELKIMKRLCTNTYPFQSNQKGVPGQTKIN